MSSSLNGLLSLGEITAVTGAPRHNVELYWPEVLHALDKNNIGQKLVQIGAVATIATEVPRFAPISEHADGSAYEGRIDLGNTQPGDGRRYKGRGFIQLTGRSNYSYYGHQLGVDLEGEPDRALEPGIAAGIFGLYFWKHGIGAKCLAYDWRGVRKAVNGGYNGYERFISIIRGFLS